MTTDERVERIAGLRELADWLEAHPDAPMPYIGRLQAFPQNTDAGRADTAAAVGELRRIGTAFGVEPVQSGPHIDVHFATFRGGIDYFAVVCNADLADFPDTDHCVCCTNDCGDRRGHVRNDRDGGDSCNCGREWPCTRES